MLSFNLPSMWCMDLLFLFLVTHNLRRTTRFFVLPQSSGWDFLVFFSHMGHPSRFYTGRPQLRLPSLSRPKTMSPVPSRDPWVLYPDLKPPALELPIIPWLWILFPLLTFGIPGSPGSGMLPLALFSFVHSCNVFTAGWEWKSSTSAPVASC